VVKVDYSGLLTKDKSVLNLTVDFDRDLSEIKERLDEDLDLIG